MTTEIGDKEFRRRKELASACAPSLFRIARMFYYFGCLTLPLLIIRFSGVTISDALFALALILTIAGVCAVGRFPTLYGIGSLVLASTAYTFSALLSSVNLPADDLLGSAFAATKFFYLTVVWFALGVMVLPSFKHVIAALSLWTMGAAISGLAGIAQTLIDPEIIPGTRSIFARAVGFTGHPNDLGASLAIALAPALALATGKAIPRARRFLTSAYLTLVVAGLILSASASAILSAAASLGAWILLTGRIRLGLILIGMAAGTLIAVGTLLETASVDLSAVADLYALSEGGKSGTFGERIDTYAAAWAYVSDQPLLGVGTKAGGWITSAGLATHNVLLGAWYETGLLGLVAIAAIIAIIVWISRSTLKLASDREMQNLVGALVGAETAFFVYSMTAPGLYQRYGWVSVAMMIALYNSLRVSRTSRRHGHFIR